MTLKELMDYFFGLYGLRNMAYLYNLKKRVDFLGVAATDLQRAVRKGVEIEKVEVALARVTSRTFCIAQHYHGHLPLIAALSQKYPGGECSYCHSYPCTCNDARPEPIISKHVAIDQSIWTLGEWQQHFDRLYGQRNRRRDIHELLSHLDEEVLEVNGTIMKISGSSSSIAEVFFAVAFELTDVLAWSCAITSRMEIDLERAVMKRYYPVCPTCQLNPCDCKIFNYNQVDW